MIERFAIPLTSRGNADDDVSTFRHATLPLMSAMYRRSRVEQLWKDIATLEGKVADERARASKSRAAGLQASGSITKSTSPSLTQTKLRDARRHEEAAVGSDKKVADFSSQIATKRKSLISAERDLASAQESERRKDAATAERQRRDDLRRIAELENARRNVYVRPVAPPPDIREVPRK